MTVEFELPPDFMDVQDEKIMAESIYALRIAKADTEKNDGTKFVTKNGEKMIRCMIEFVENSEGSNIFHYLIIPNENSKAGTVRMTKRFLIAFGVNFQSGLSGEDAWREALLGCEAQMSVGIEHSDEYGDKNKLNLPKFD